MNTYKKILAVIFVLVFVWSSISPESLVVWILESIPVIAGVSALLILSYKLKLSDFSFTVVVFYLVLCLMPPH